MYEKILQEIGLTVNESKVYISLLSLGKSKSGKILERSKISSGKIYETLNKLSDKGLVRTITENGIKYFIPNPPSTLFDYLDKKKQEISTEENQLKKIVPELSKIQENKKENSASLTKGIKGIYSMVYDCLRNTKDEILIMGIISEKQDKFNDFWRHWHKERVRLKKSARIIFSDKDTKYRNFFDSLKYTQVREIMHLTPSAIMVIDANVFIFSYDEDLTCTHIYSPSTSDSLSAFFEDLWKFSKD